MVDDGTLPLYEVALFDVLACICHQSEIEGEVVDAGNLHCQKLLCFEKVVEVCLGCYAVDIATIRINRAEIHFPFLIAHVHGAIIGEQHGISSVSGRHDAVKHINPSFDGFQNVLWSTYSHEIARLVLRKNLIDHLYHLIHHFCRFTYGKTTDGISVGTLVGYILSCFSSQFREGTSLYDREETLVVAIERFCLIEALDATVQQRWVNSKLFFAYWKSLCPGGHSSNAIMMSAPMIRSVSMTSPE